LSMGGYAAINLALKYPGTFEVAASISGAFNAPLAELEQRSDLRPSLERAFGAPQSKTRMENDVYRQVANADVNSTAYLFIDCGNEDATFLQPNRRLAAVLSQRKLKYEYHELPGAHTWEYWDQRIQAVLKVVAEHIAAEEQP
jgi:putative tributyrin esterase